MKLKKYAHFILAFIGGLVTGVISVLAVHHTHWLAHGTSVVLILAFWYEWHQCVDLKMLNKYESWKAFRKDSLKDMKQDLAGLFVGLFVGLGISSLIVKLI